MGNDKPWASAHEARIGVIARSNVLNRKEGGCDAAYLFLMKALRSLPALADSWLFFALGEA
jgi:hypothetical protein